MKIGIYIGEFIPNHNGGVDSGFIRSVKSFLECFPQHEFILLANPEAGDSLRKTFKGDRLKIELISAISSRQAFISRGLRAFWAYLRNSSAIALEIQRYNLNLVFFPRQILAIKKLKIPSVIMLYDIQHEYYPEFFDKASLEWRSAAYKDSMLRASAIVVAADSTRKTIAEHAPEVLSKVRHIFPGIDDSVAEIPVARLREKYGLPEQFIFYPANSWLHKNHARLFAALRRLRDKEGIAIPIVCTGALVSEAPARIKTLAIAADIEELVYDLGFLPQDEIASFYAAAKFLVHPSLFEGFGFPIVEAMRLGCPVTCAEATCLPEVAGDAALLFNPFEVDDIAQSIKTLWFDEALRGQLIERGKENIKRF